jgi:SAM-dependent methyltransferase
MNKKISDASIQIKKIIPESLKIFIKSLSGSLATLLGKYLLTPLNLLKNKNNLNRCLEIGPGDTRISGFETLNILGGNHVDYVCDASRKLPFGDDTFEIIYASHILEHIPWFKIEEVLREWARILRPGGSLEIWVPDGLKICKALVDYELLGINDIEKDGWYRFNPNKCPYKWISGRLFTYGDGTGNPCHPNWHRALFTPQYVKQLMSNVGLINVRLMSETEVRGANHGWINLGVKGIKTI